MLTVGLGNTDHDVRVELAGQLGKRCINNRPIDRLVDIGDVFGQQNQIRVPSDVSGSL
ncbi:hypothetical protein CETAM_13645 (plasmid) [Corynebacterium comes]|uniref:Uncharacterized protein n=1 Tax=Corynebacterium comes TaxID=2675218 RepID=A0A6B8VX82_9CORY|nr:hypothetical protein CETAM_13645 [Corynebacterium comes]